jgi:hypothetical protein
MTFGTLALLAGIIGSAPALLPAGTAVAQPVAAAAVQAEPQDPVKPKAAQRPSREPAPEGRRADPPRREPAAEPARREPRREEPRAEPRTAPAERRRNKDAERPRSTGEPELRRRKP